MRKLASLVLLSLLSLLTLYVLLLSLVSIAMGLTNTDRPGFWMPVVCGALVVWLSTYLIRLIVYVGKRLGATDGYHSD